LKVGTGINAQVLADTVTAVLRRHGTPFPPTFTESNSFRIDTDYITDEKGNRYWHCVIGEIDKDGQTGIIKVVTVPRNGKVDQSVPNAIRDAIEKQLLKRPEGSHRDK
jgi:hypothetical protein